MSRGGLRLAPMLATLTLVASCGGKPPPPPPPPASLDLAIRCAADQNPDIAGQPAPVAIKLFFLNASAKFERADVFALMERERATLGEDMAGSEEFVLRPGETRAIARMPKSGVQFLGVAVLFRDIDRADWRAVQPVAATGPTKLQLDITGIRAMLAPAK